MDAWGYKQRDHLALWLVLLPSMKATECREPPQQMCKPSKHLPNRYQNSSPLQGSFGSFGPEAQKSQNDQKPGNHPNFRKNALGVKRPFSEVSESSGVFSEQPLEYEIPFLEWHLTTWAIRKPQFSEQLPERCSEWGAHMTDCHGAFFPGIARDSRKEPKIGQLLILTHFRLGFGIWASGAERPQELISNSLGYFGPEGPPCFLDPVCSAICSGGKQPNSSGRMKLPTRSRASPKATLGCRLLL